MSKRISRQSALVGSLRVERASARRGAPWALLLGALTPLGCFVATETSAEGDETVIVESTATPEPLPTSWSGAANPDPCQQALVLGDDHDVIAAPTECHPFDLDQGDPGPVVQHEIQQVVITP